MSDLRKAAKMALITLEEKLAVLEPTKYAETIEALRQALEQEDKEQGRIREITRQFVGVKEDGSERWVETEYRTVTGREWVGLNKSDMNVLRSVAEFTSDAEGFVRLVEEKLKEKNT